MLPTSCLFNPHNQPTGKWGSEGFFNLSNAMQLGSGTGWFQAGSNDLKSRILLISSMPSFFPSARHWSSSNAQRKLPSAKITARDSVLPGSPSFQEGDDQALCHVNSWYWCVACCCLAKRWIPLLLRKCKWLLWSPCLSASDSMAATFTGSSTAVQAAASDTPSPKMT